MSPESRFGRELSGAVAVYRVKGVFDRATAWALRDRIEADSASEILIDTSLVRDFSDLAVAVLAHGLTISARRVAFRGLRQHQLRILRYCGVPVDERALTPTFGVAAAVSPAEPPRPPEAQ